MAEDNPYESDARAFIAERIKAGNFMVSASENLILTDLTAEEKQVFERLDAIGLAVLLEGQAGPRVSVNDAGRCRQAYVRRDADIRQWLTATVAADDYQLLHFGQVRIGDEALTPERFQWLDGLRGSTLIAVQYRSAEDIDVLIQDRDLLLFALDKREKAIRGIIGEKIEAGAYSLSPDGEVWLKGITPGQEVLLRNSRASDLIDVQGGERIIVSIKDPELKRQALARRQTDQPLIRHGHWTDGETRSNGTGPASPNL